MRYAKYLMALFLILPVAIVAQTGNDKADITGLWKGTLYNDTTQQFYKYEVGISEEKGKLTGFSHTWFILEDKQYYGVKKVKVKRQDGKIVIEDAGLIANNYPVAPAKGVRQLNILVLNTDDSVMTLSGPFTTNATKDYRPLTGSIKLERRNDYWQSALVPHLQELNLVSELSFVKDDVLLARNTLTPEQTRTLPLKIKEDVTKPLATKAIVKNITPTQTNTPPENSIAGAKTNATLTPEKISTATIPQTKEPTTLSVNKSDTVYSIAGNVKNAEQKLAPTIAANKPTETIVKSEDAKVATKKPLETVVQMPRQVFAQQEKITDVKAVAALNVKERTTLIQQTVSFKSDSLQLSLYDNGEVDGDTVSVLMNGNIIMSKERLSTNAVRKTIYIPQNTDTVQLVMYAENLGLIPPNTGLLVVKDGKDLYEIRFSGDLQKNAAIIFKRKKVQQ